MTEAYKLGYNKAILGLPKSCPFLPYSEPTPYKEWFLGWVKGEQARYDPEERLYGKGFCILNDGLDKLQKENK